MGLLDDAIREHLELKRSHGADPDEVERQEREALGAAAPGRVRGPGRGRAGRRRGRRKPGRRGRRARRRRRRAEPFEAGEEREPFDVESLEPVERASAGPASRPARPATTRIPWLEEERDEVPADEALDHPREPAEEQGEDVLEDTPDFLQETPEHDRLWFEQKPPRDFDWDK